LAFAVAEPRAAPICTFQHLAKAENQQLAKDEIARRPAIGHGKPAVVDARRKRLHAKMDTVPKSAIVSIIVRTPARLLRRVSFSR
jgi:hypothetical protein